MVTGDHWQSVYEACSPIRGFFVRNEAFQDGIGKSIACGVRAVAESADAVLLVLADQPLISTDYLEQMIDIWRSADTRIVCSKYAGINGPPAIFPATCFADLMRLTGDKGARAILEANSANVITVPCEDAAFDVDEPDDLLRLES